MILYQWAARWGIPLEAIKDLETVYGTNIPNVIPLPDQRSEAAVSADIRLEAAEATGVYLWRNNVGATKDLTGRLLRYGLANDSKKVNEIIKSGDLIGCRRVTITPAMVGSSIGQFVSRECKPAGWVPSWTDHEQAQQRWIDLIVSLGGDARFATGRGTL